LISKLKELADLLPTRGLDEYVGHLGTHGYPWNRKRICRAYKMMRLEKRRKLKNIAFKKNKAIYRFYITK